MPETIPDTMRALVFDHYEDELSEAVAGLKVVERPLPMLSPGQVPTADQTWRRDWR